jgi:hypothetical protein
MDYEHFYDYGMGLSLLLPRHWRHQGQAKNHGPTSGPTFDLTLDIII